MGAGGASRESEAATIARKAAATQLLSSRTDPPQSGSVAYWNRLLIEPQVDLSAGEGPPLKSTRFIPDSSNEMLPQPPTT